MKQSYKEESGWYEKVLKKVLCNPPYFICGAFDNIGHNCYVGSHN